MIRKTQIEVTTTGSAGSATGTGYSPRAYNGEVLAMRVDWNASAPATSDIDIVSESDDDSPEITLYDKDNANTDLWVYPKVQSTDTAGAAITAEYQHIAIDGRIKVTLGGCDALDPAVTVTVYIREY